MIFFEKWNEIQTKLFLIIIIILFLLSKGEIMNNPIKISDHSNPMILQSTAKYYIFTSGELIIINQESGLIESNSTFPYYSSPNLLIIDQSNNYFIFSRNKEEKKCYIISLNGQSLNFPSYTFSNSDKFIGYIKESEYHPGSFISGCRCDIPENEIIIYGKNNTNSIVFTYIYKNLAYSISMDTDNFEDKIICKSDTSSEYICALVIDSKIYIYIIIYKERRILLITECYFEVSKVLIPSMVSHTEVQLYDLSVITNKILCAKNKNNLNIECIVIYISIKEETTLIPPYTDHSISVNYGTDIILSFPMDSDNNGDCAIKTFNLELLFCCGGINIIKCARLENNFNLKNVFTLNIPGENNYLHIYTGLSYSFLFYMNTLFSQEKIYEYYIYSRMY